MKMNELLKQITSILDEEQMNGNNIYEVVFYIKGRKYVIRNMKLDYYKFEWNLSLMEVGSEEYNHRFYNDTIKLYDMLKRGNYYLHRFQNLLHKKVNFVYRNYGYTYHLYMTGLKIKGKSVSEYDSQITFYFE